MARWHEQLQDYNFKIIHIAGKINTPADMLLRLIGEDVPKDSWEVVLLPLELFINVFGTNSDGFLEHHIVLAQWVMSGVMKDWVKHLPIQWDN